VSVKHPIIAVTGSSGSGVSSTQVVFERIFSRNHLSSVMVHGNAFRRYRHDEVGAVFKEFAEKGKPISHFGPQANLLDRLEGLFREYSRTGTGSTREYIDDTDMSEAFSTRLGEYTPWTEIPEGTDLLFYEGQHGGCIESTWSRRNMSPSHNPLVVQERQHLVESEDSGIDIARWVDLLIGVVPSINLEWIQKIQRDCSTTGCSTEEVTKTILRRMPDYVNYIVPQFSLTDINFQRVPTVDTSFPFAQRDIPTPDESFVVIRFREPKKFDFPSMLRRISNSFMSRPNTLVAPGAEMERAMEVICEPLVLALLERVKAVPNNV